MELQKIKDEYSNIDNCAKLVIKDSSSICSKTLLYYSYYLSDDKTKSSMFGQYKKFSSVIETDEKNVNFCCPLDGLIFKYKELENEYKCIIKQILKSTSHIIDKYTESDTNYFTILYVDNGSEKIIEKIIHSAMKYYKDNIVKFKENKDYITIYSWDEYSKCWERSGKKKKRNTDTIYLDKGFLEEVIVDIKQFLSDEYKEIYETYGVPYKRNYLFEGIPGTGKSSLISAIASELNYSISILQLTSKITDDMLIKIIEELENNTILVLEDIDCLFEKRENKSTLISFSGLLNTLDGMINKDNGLLVIMTTNFKAQLDSALIRPGRIDKCVNFTYATKYQIESMYNKFFPDYSFEKFWKKVNGYKVTIAMLQKMLMPYLFHKKDEENEENILKNVKKELIELTNDHQYDKGQEVKMFM